tara:strand:- start:1742 stop:2281 length:540 start_codon:yes stop_codon:yes gene_type:complete
MRKSIPFDNTPHTPTPQITWVIVYDSKVGRVPPFPGAINLLSPYTGCYGNPNRNFALDSLAFKDSDWIYILDDDNIIHPHWYKGVLPYLNDNKFLKWGQVSGKPGQHDKVRLPPDSPIKKRHIDTACYMVRWDVQKDIRYIDWRTADFTMAEDVSKVCQPTIINKNLCYYNYLRFAGND